MSTSASKEATAKVHVENIGGIDDTTITFSPGVTILAGRNASNRTSLLQAIMAACGSNNVSLKGDAEAGSVELTIGENTYTRTLRQQGDTVVFDGDSYLEDSDIADLFAFLLESNEARLAVARRDDLRNLIMRPVDSEAIQAEITHLRQERERIDTELQELENLKGRLPELEEERTRLQDQIEEKREELAAKESEIEAADASVEETREEKDELEQRLADLREKRDELEDVRYDLETQRESLEAIQSERSELEDELTELPDAPMGEREEIDQQIAQLREEKQEFESEVSDLQSLIQFNEQQIESADDDLLADIETNRGAQANTEGEVTDQLLQDEQTTCWTCGSEVAVEQIEATIDQLRERSKEKVARVSEYEQELKELKADRDELQSQQRQREQIEQRLSSIEDEVDDREATIERLQDRRERLTDDIGGLETTVEELESDTYSEILDLHKEANQIEFDLGRLESDLEDVEEEIGTIENRLSKQDQLEAQRKEVQAEIEDLRTRIERIETQAIEEFNRHMETVLDLLDYDNLERIWLERIEREVREGRRKVDKSIFELHVIRKTASGKTYEDTVDHLSESEREVTGLVFALAGYLSHEVYETLPIILLDSLEAIDSDRIAALIDYLEEFAEYLIVALLPEDAAALHDQYERISDI